MATNKELQDAKVKFEKLTPSNDPNSEYQKTLAFIKNAEAERTSARQSATNKFDREKATKDAAKARKERTSDLSLLESLKNEIRRRTDLGQTVSEIIQTQYDELSKKYPEVISSTPKSIKVAESVTSETPKVTPTPTPTQPTAEPVVPKVPATASAAAKAKAVKEKGKVPKAPVKTSIEEILDQLGIVEAIANQDEEISDLVKQYADGKLTEKGFRQGLRTSRWRSTNSDTIRQRKTNLAIYNALTPEERAQGSNSYALEVNAIIDNLQTNATSKGAVIPKDQLRTLAEKLYITGQEATDNVVLGSLKPFIKLSVNPVTGAPTVGGAAGDNYRKLVATANANGLTIKELPAVLGYSTIDEALQAIAGGESIATLQQNVRNFRMTGQPDFISAKLAQGIDYGTIVSPYRTTAATVLELDPEKIKLDDPAIQLALQNNGMNLFDYKKALKKDSRWQYTENANEEVSNKFLRIAQDFGLEA